LNKIKNIVITGIILVLIFSVQVSAKDFDLVCLGAGGGDFTDDVISFMVKPDGIDYYSLILDGGSIAEGILAHGGKTGQNLLKMDPEDKVKYVASVLKKVEGILLTHSHLDHVSGFSILGPLFLNMHFQWKTPSFRVIASPETIDNLEKYLYSGKIWGNFGHFPKDNTILKYERNEIGKTVEIGGLSVERFSVRHKVESSAYLLTNKNGNKMMFFGDTGTLGVEFYKKFRNYIDNKKLKGIILEVSFPSTNNKLANSTTHLTRDLLVLELSKFAGLEMPEKLNYTEEEIEKYAKKAAEKINFPVMIIHIKPWDYKQIVKELNDLKKYGINIIIAEKGNSYSF